ncbi:MAG: type II toxin-antitoxin system VapC family toxin [Alicyclobacillus mali]|uniref:type II toxin-antitoxin system tRNA(fMet)-specific endonuclease VapC n=1 Tax=Alicyclobacillus mali (ex Roth et al. 2021) TaxID=1123961 RepID=UPI0023F25D43|nr:type II toxin-antitoxin system VapC family toxin [Alicyclobacillus mali (ex Roth et al. 2021)]MCL6488414.1 type II toxin-antitoxin system VapC family toxin [Alicyclobacillus mali (ex Roth et al. 2021)]
MRYLLDTNMCIYLINRRNPALIDRFRRYRTGDIGVSVITVAELMYGVAKSQHQERNRAALSAFLLPLEVAPFDERAAFHYGQIRAQLESEGQPIGAMDTLIAAHALSLGVTVVTRNVLEFQRVRGLRVENWFEDI